MKNSKLKTISSVFGWMAVGLALGTTGCLKAVNTREADAPAAIAPALSDARRSVAIGSASGLIRFNYATGELTQLCKEAIDDASRRLTLIAGVPANSRTPENTILAFEGTMTEFSDSLTPLTFMGYVSTDKKISAEGSACEELVGQFNVSVYSRKDIYNTIKDVSGRGASEKRLVSETLRGFEQNGLKLSDEKLARVKELKTRLTTLETQFSSNLNKDTNVVEFDKAELAGVSPGFLARLKKTPAGKYIVTTKSTDYIQVMENAKISESRRKMQLAYMNRAADKNTKLLEDAILLRQEIATVMGFSTWADYRIQGRMAKDGEMVLKFLNGLKDKLALRDRADLAKLLAFKKEHDPTATEIKFWDLNYLAYQLKKRNYHLDDDKIREFFPAEIVIQGMFDVYSKLLSVKYVEVKEARTWSPGVKLYRIEDARSGQEGRIISYFYTDFFPRPGKYGHAAAFSLVSGRKLADGTYSHPVSSIVANMNPPAGGKPSLLNHSEVVTLFHEFGHIMHQTLTRAPYASLAGSSTAQDFVEAPSQMLENWVWSPEILSKLSGHYLDHKRKLPAALLGKLIEARDFNQGLFYTRQLMLALLDMNYHTAQGPVDTTAVQARLYKEIIGVESIPGGHFQAGFGHLMGGYDAGYYGYLWSEVYAADMFTQFEKSGLLSPELGANYRRNILERGNMFEALDLIKDFMGRAPNNQAFFRKLGIGD